MAAPQLAADDRPRPVPGPQPLPFLIEHGSRTLGEPGNLPGLRYQAAPAPVPGHGASAMMRRMLLAGASWLAISAATAEAAPIAFSYTGAIESFAVPTSGRWEIVAAGAQGGTAFGGGGLGARVGGEFTLSVGSMLRILVGGQGGQGDGFYAGGGGGGSFVVTGAGLALAVAGGGGGGSYRGGGGPGLATPSGGTAAFFSDSFAGGVGGAGGRSDPGSSGLFRVGAGGGGLTGDGQDGPDGSRGGRAFANGGGGGAGGANFSGFSGGGFGGGGGGVSYGGGGGGGGFGGGAGNMAGGAGGGSFLAASAQSPVLLAGVQSGNGLVTLEYLGPVPVPAPAGLPVLAAGLLGLAALRRRG